MTVSNMKILTALASTAVLALGLYGCGGGGGDGPVTSSETTMPDDGATMMPDDGETTMPDDGATTMPDDGATMMPDDGETTMPDDGATMMPDDGETTMPDDGMATEFEDGLVAGPGTSPVATSDDDTFENVIGMKLTPLLSPTKIENVMGNQGSVLHEEDDVAYVNRFPTVDRIAGPSSTLSMIRRRKSNLGQSIIISTGLGVKM